MIYSVEEIKERVKPIAEKYGFNVIRQKSPILIVG
jgi:hypothetical protein